MAEEEKKDAAEEKKPDVSDATQVEAANETKKTVTPFMQRTAPAGLLLAKVYTPFKVFFEGEAKSLTAVNETGRFDVLPGHRNFLTMLVPCEIIIQTTNAKAPTKTIPIIRGLMHIKDNKIIVFLDV